MVAGLRSAGVRVRPLALPRAPWIVEPTIAGLRAAGVLVPPLALPRAPWIVLAPGEGFAWAPEVDAAGWMMPWVATFAWALR